jgi:hypothetical protein
VALGKSETIRAADFRGTGQASWYFATSLRTDVMLRMVVGAPMAFDSAVLLTSESLSFPRQYQ